MNEIVRMSLTELSGALMGGQLSAREACQAYLDHIAQTEYRIGAYITLCPEEALRQADAIDGRRSGGEKLHPLAGVPVAVKDNICTMGVKTTCGSHMLADFVPPYSATAWERLQSAGGVLLGKTNMDEFGMGSSTENSAFHLTRNPHDEARNPGGSSGGSAAAVAAGEACAALGSDTGGSIRQPAGLCGVVGMKPTYGQVSRSGLVAFASSLEQIGPMTRTVADNALLLEVIAGQDKRDSTSIKRSAAMDSQLHQGVKGLTVGLVTEMFQPGMDADVRAAVLHAAKVLDGLGARVTEISLPSVQYALPAYYVISSAEASSNLARFDGVRYGRRAAPCDSLDDLYIRSRSEGFGPEVQRRILLGTYALSEGHAEQYYQQALKVRTLVIRDFARAFAACDVLIAPVSPHTAGLLGAEKTSPTEAYYDDIDTVPVNIAGIPALSMPCGRDARGLPVGVQLMGPALSEPMLYRVGFALERALGEVTVP